MLDLLHFAGEHLVAFVVFTLVVFLVGRAWS
jgi:hypothetical protein